MDNSRIEQDLLDLYNSNSDIIEEGWPTEINAMRGEAMAAFEELGLPSKRNEKYKYIDIRSLYEKNYEKYFVPRVNEHCCNQDLPIECYPTQTCNGYVVDSTKITVLDDGVIYGGLAAAAERYPDIVKGYYNTLADNKTEALTALNTAFTQDGFFLYVPAGKRVTKPIYVLNAYYSDEDILSFGRNLMIFEHDSHAQVVFDHRNASENDVLTNTVRECFLGRGAKIDIVEIQRQNYESKLLTNSYVTQGANSNFKSVMVTLNGGVVRNNQNVKIVEPGAENHTYGLALGSGNQYIDNFTDVEHLCPDCTSYEHFKGIASAEATVVFNGRIYVAQDAQRTQAFQENRNLLLSDAARIYTKPQLEIYADDVKCSHGATIGQLDSEAIFYMRQRGINESNARRLQVYGFVNDVIAKVDMESLSEFLDAIATAKIEKL